MPEEVHQRIDEVIDWRRTVVPILRGHGHPRSLCDRHQGVQIALATQAVAKVDCRDADEFGEFVVRDEVPSVRDQPVRHFGGAQQLDVHLSRISKAYVVRAFDSHTRLFVELVLGNMNLPVVDRPKKDPAKRTEPDPDAGPVCPQCLATSQRAGDGNRTRVLSLGS